MVPLLKNSAQTMVLIPVVEQDFENHIYCFFKDLLKMIAQTTRKMNSRKTSLG